MHKRRLELFSKGILLQINGEFPTLLFLNSHLSQSQNFYQLSAYRILKLFSLLIVLNQPELRICYSFLAINFLVETPRSIFCVKRQLNVRYILVVRAHTNGCRDVKVALMRLCPALWFNWYKKQYETTYPKCLQLLMVGFTWALIILYESYTAGTLMTYFPDVWIHIIIVLGIMSCTKKNCNFTHDIIFLN